MSTIDQKNTGITFMTTAMFQQINKSTFSDLEELQNFYSLSSHTQFPW